MASSPAIFPVAWPIALPTKKGFLKEKYAILEYLALANVCHPGRAAKTS
jgi:hypothetical protein